SSSNTLLGFFRSTFCAIIAQLTEETQPLFETTLKSYAVSENSDAKFTCIVTGYPQPEVTWYKDDEEMDRYCGLPKYEIFHHGNHHTLQLYKCREEDAAIYQASARNSKGIVSCSGVLEVGTMTEYKIHQRWFAKLKWKAEAKMHEIEHSRRRGKENMVMDQLRRVSPDRFQRKRRLTGDMGLHSGTSVWKKEDVTKVHIPELKLRLQEDDTTKPKEPSLNATPGLSNNFIPGPLVAEVTTNGDSSLESGEENDSGFLAYFYETMEKITSKPTAKESFSKKKKKDELATQLEANQEVSRRDDTREGLNFYHSQIDATSVTSPKSTPPMATSTQLMEKEPGKSPSLYVEMDRPPPCSLPAKEDVYFSLKDMYFDSTVKPGTEEKLPQVLVVEGEGQKEPVAEQESEENKTTDTNKSPIVEIKPSGDLNRRRFQPPSPESPESGPERQCSFSNENTMEIPNDRNVQETDLQDILLPDAKQPHQPACPPWNLVAPLASLSLLAQEMRGTKSAKRQCPHKGNGKGGGGGRRAAEAAHTTGIGKPRTQQNTNHNTRPGPKAPKREWNEGREHTRAHRETTTQDGEQTDTQEGTRTPGAARSSSMERGGRGAAPQEGQHTQHHGHGGVWKPKAKEAERPGPGTGQDTVKGTQKQTDSTGSMGHPAATQPESAAVGGEVPPQPESAQNSNTSTEPETQHMSLVSSLKNYLLLLLKMSTESDKSKGSTEHVAETVQQGSQPAGGEEALPGGIAVLTPRTSRKIFERVKNNQLFQSAERLQLSPRTSRKLTGMINQELLTNRQTLAVSPLASEPEDPSLPSIPSIVVGDVPEDGLSDMSEAVVALPSATPQELASGARRKIYLPKVKQGDEVEGDALDHGKRDSSTVSPQQTHKNVALLEAPVPSPSPPMERRSPTLARKMATLEVPKIYKETPDESKSMADSNLGVQDSPMDSQQEVKAEESWKANDPFKAPQVIRKIRAEQFSDASGNLKLWCQFFNVLSDSKLTWYKDEVPVAEARRSSGDESQAALAIVQASSKDCGVYQCTIENKYGTDTTDFLLSAEVLSGFISREEIEVGEEIEMTPMVFAKGLADSGYWGDKLFGRILIEDMEVGTGFLHKACRARAIYGLEPIFESGCTGIIQVRNLIAFGDRSESTLVERNYDITIQECKIQNSSREYGKIFAAEARAIPAFGPVPEIIPRYLIYRPANNIPYATMEEDLSGSFECYCMRQQDSSLTSSASETGHKCNTFQHWLYQWTNGNILVTDLQGVGWKVTNVSIATKSKGYQGLKESCCPTLLEHFAVTHQCNHYCQLLGLKTIETPQLTKAKGSKSPSMGRKAPSAQSSPQLQKKGLVSPQGPRKSAVSPKNTRKYPQAPEPEPVPKPRARESSKGTRFQ
uniref:non-specific serine/threonine protein kinase n=1 Tax=Sphenodon punctatus TaxID=8508 RepID=A0A8D0LC03_SPHPU